MKNIYLFDRPYLLHSGSLVFAVAWETFSCSMQDLVPWADWTQAPCTGHGESQPGKSCDADF